MFSDRDWIPAQIPLEKPFSEKIIEEFIMKSPVMYDTMDVMSIIKACDGEYLSIKAEVNAKERK